MKLKQTESVRAARSKQSRQSDRLAHALELLEKGEALECQNSLRKILRYEPDHVGALEMMARCQWRTSDFESALATVGGLVKLNPYEPGYFYLRGLIFQSLGQVANAAISFERCRAFPDSELALKAEQSIRELHTWQQEGIQHLLELDQEFRLRYLQDSASALSERGLIPLDSIQGRRVSASEPSGMHLHDRPS